jgi:hypothetical protein
MIKLGDKVKDEVSGFVGIAVCATDYLSGCRRIGIQAVTKDNKSPADWVYIDETQLIVMKSKIVKEKSKKKGGMRPDPDRGKTFTRWA